MRRKKRLQKQSSDDLMDKMIAACGKQLADLMKKMLETDDSEEFQELITRYNFLFEEYLRMKGEWIPRVEDTEGWEEMDAGDKEDVEERHRKKYRLDY